MLPSCALDDSGILVAHVGNPLANGCEDPFKRISSHRFVVLTGFMVSQEEDEHGGELVLEVWHVTKGRGLLMWDAEGGPDSKDFGLASLGLGSCGSAGDLESSACISLEQGSGDR